MSRQPWFPTTYECKLDSKAEERAKKVAYGDSARIEELRREIAEIHSRSKVGKYPRRTQQVRAEFDRRDSRLREIQAELHSMMKKGAGT
jgi:DNA repair exonuclease SbcCD ATPase subunit